MVSALDHAILSNWWSCSCLKIPFYDLVRQATPRIDLFTLATSMFIPRKSRRCETIPVANIAQGLDSAKIVGRKTVVVWWFLGIVLSGGNCNRNPSLAELRTSSARSHILARDGRKRVKVTLDISANPIGINGAIGNIQGNMTALRSQVTYSNFASTNSRNIHFTPQTVMLGEIPPSINHGWARKVAIHGMALSSLKLVSLGFNHL